jgi:hypothetical protein
MMTLMMMIVVVDTQVKEMSKVATVMTLGLNIDLQERYDHGHRYIFF